MLGIRQWSNRRKATLVAALALLLWLPSGISVNTGPLVTGHSTFYNGTGFDPCLASIVGVMRTDVRWFNDMVLVERYGGKGTFVYITENGADDPREKQFLYSDGVTYDFTDPNGATWHVEELWYPKGNHVPGSELPDTTDPNDFGGATVYHENQKHYVWVVELSAQPVYDLYAPKDKNHPYYHTVYNFVALVDTCRFHRTDPATNYNGNHRNQTTGQLDYNITHNESTLNDQWGHRPTDNRHTHEAFLANLYVGKRPVVTHNPNTNQLQPSWQDEWIGVGVG